MVKAWIKSESSFQVLLAEARAGEESAWAELIRPLLGPIRGYLQTRGAQDPEDVTAETFLHVARAIHNFEGDEESFRSWVFVIAHRRLIDSRRQESRRPTQQYSRAPMENIVGGNVEEEALEAMGDQTIDHILSGLTEQQKEVLALRILADLSVEETARVMGKRKGAVKTLQHRAIAAAKKQMTAKDVTK